MDASMGLQRRQTIDGQAHYLRCGEGDTAVLLVNAFGLSMDVWHDLVALLSPRFTVLVVDEDAPPIERGGVPRTTYASPDSLQRFERAARSILASEGRASCHVASWCSGAKFAIELARAWPEGIASLMLFAPSFAGAEGGAGADSAYETNLNTMCTLVDRMPRSAESMARSMTALMAKSATADEAATLPWVRAPFASAANMVEYSRQLLNFRAHQLGPNPGGEPLPLPVLLVTAERDHTTSSERAAAICNDVARPVHFDLQAAGHYFIHQDSRLVAQLMHEFVARGEQASPIDPRLVRIDAPACLVCGEL
jgi:pimeloyl-ACP methyl ester carboxylesterase